MTPYILLNVIKASSCNYNTYANLLLPLSEVADLVRGLSYTEHSHFDAPKSTRSVLTKPHCKSIRDILIGTDKQATGLANYFNKYDQNFFNNKFEADVVENILNYKNFLLYWNEHKTDDALVDDPVINERYSSFGLTVTQLLEQHEHILSVSKCYQAFDSLLYILRQTEDPATILAVLSIFSMFHENFTKDGFDKYISNYIWHYRNNTAPQPITYRKKLSSAYMDRPAFIASLINASQNNRYVFVCGEAGIGKTEIVALTMHSLDNRSVAYLLQYNTSIRKTIATMPTKNVTAEHANEDEQFEYNLGLLRNFVLEDDYLFIDNFDGEDMTAMLNDPDLNKLDTLKCHVVFLTRNNIPIGEYHHLDYTSLEVEKFSVATLTTLFEKNACINLCTVKQRERIGNVIEKVYRNTLLVNLLARYVACNCEGADLDASVGRLNFILDRNSDILNRAAQELRNDAAVNSNSALMQKFVDILYDEMQWNESEKDVLFFCSFLNNTNGIDYDLLTRLLDKNTLDRIIDRGWLDCHCCDSKITVTIHPLIAVAAEKARPSQAAIDVFFLKASSIYKKEQPEPPTILSPFADMLLNVSRYFAKPEHAISNRCDILQTLSLVLGYLGRHLEMEMCEISLIESLESMTEDTVTCENISEKLAEAYNSYAITLSKSAKYTQAIEYIDKAIHIAQTYDLPRLLNFRNTKAYFCNKVWRYAEFFDEASLVLDIRRCTPTTNKLDLARSYDNCAAAIMANYIYASACDRDRFDIDTALEHIDAALDIYNDPTKSNAQFRVQGYLLKAKILTVKGGHEDDVKLNIAEAEKAHTMRLDILPHRLDIDIHRAKGFICEYDHSYVKAEAEYQNAYNIAVQRKEPHSFCADLYSLLLKAKYLQKNPSRKTLFLTHSDILNVSTEIILNQSHGCDYIALDMTYLRYSECKRLIDFLNDMDRTQNMPSCILINSQYSQVPESLVFTRMNL